MNTTKASSRIIRSVEGAIKQQFRAPTAQRHFCSQTARPFAWRRGSDGKYYDDSHSNARFGPAVTGGLVGGGAVFLAGYIWDEFFAEPRPVPVPNQARQAFPDDFKVQFRDITPGPTDEVIKSLREVAEKYSAWIPGGRDYVDKAFRDLEKIREKHEMEVNAIVRDTYEELRDVANRKGSSLDTVNATWYILWRRLDELSSLAGDVAQQILEGHPEMREKLDGSFENLRLLGDRLGPGAKKEVDETFSEISRLVKQGVDVDTPDRINRIISDKAQQIKMRGEQAWSTSWEQIQPLLERQPRVKQIVEENIPTLKQGRAKEVVEKIRQAVLSGSTGELERYIKDVSKKSQQASSGSLTNWLNRVPSGSKILPQLQKMKEAADTKSSDAERLAKDTLNDIAELLDQRGQQVDRYLRSAGTQNGGGSEWFRA